MPVKEMSLHLKVKKKHEYKKTFFANTLVNSSEMCIRGWIQDYEWGGGNNDFVAPAKIGK